jgi:hypothetical protein
MAGSINFALVSASESAKAGIIACNQADPATFTGGITRMPIVDLSDVRRGTTAATSVRVKAERRFFGLTKRRAERDILPPRRRQA